MIDMLPIVGPILSIIGALLTTSIKPRWRLVGFCVWIVSNAILAAWSVSTGEMFVFAMYATFGVISAWGVMTNAKALRGVVA
jgi:hypothetical protein